MSKEWYTQPLLLWGSNFRISREKEILHFPFIQQTFYTFFNSRYSSIDWYYFYFGCASYQLLHQPLPKEVNSILFSKGDEVLSLSVVHQLCYLGCCWMVQETSHNAYKKIVGKIPQWLSSPNLLSIHELFWVFTWSELWDLSWISWEKLVEELMMRKGIQGDFYNLRNISMGLTTATSAAVYILRKLKKTIPPESILWLKNCQHSQLGGYRLHPHTPFPDLLSTLAAFIALVGMDWKDQDQARAIQFLNSLEDSQQGGYRLVSSLSVTPDLESTFYGLFLEGAFSCGMS